MTQSCDDLRHDPVALGEHAASCAGCAEYLRELERFQAQLREASAEFPVRDVAPVADRLPVAPWEGSAHRSWPLAFAVILVFLAAAAALFMTAGHSPAAGIAATIQSIDGSRRGTVSLLTAVGDVIRHAPAAIQVLIASMFVTFNLILLALLRRPVRGYDAARR